MKHLLFIYGITELKLEKIGQAIRPFAKEEMGFLMMNKSVIINIDIDENFPAEIVIDCAKEFTKQPIFLLDMKSSKMAFTLSNEDSLALFDEDFDSLCRKTQKTNERSFMEEFEDEDDEIKNIIDLAEKSKPKFDLDNILDKISSNGFNSLNRREKNFLKNYGNHEG